MRLSLEALAPAYLTRNALDGGTASPTKELVFINRPAGAQATP